MLRKKIASKRAERTGGGGGGLVSLGAQIRNDPTSALLSMGIDDASVLAHATKLSSMAPDMLQQTARTLKQQTATHAESSRPTNRACDVEEAPPPTASPTTAAAAPPSQTTARCDDAWNDNEEEAPPPPP